MAESSTAAPALPAAASAAHATTGAAAPTDIATDKIGSDSTSSPSKISVAKAKHMPKASSLKVGEGPSPRVLTRTEEHCVTSTQHLTIPHLSDIVGPGASLSNIRYSLSNAAEQPVLYSNYKGSDEAVLRDVVRHSASPKTSWTLVRAGPRKQLYFDPAKTNACIVTCGGLCPGLNNVIREIVLTLEQEYGMETIYGIRFGFRGFHDASTPPMMLSASVVSGIQNQGGSIIGSGRGGLQGHEDEVFDFIRGHNIQLLFVIGGDGTHRGANLLARRAAALDTPYPLAVAGIPKTIDNDIGIIDRSFGFETAVSEAVEAIKSAKVEASCLKNGVGIVKLMGRHAGYIAVHATLSSQDVDLCLIPELPLRFEGRNNQLDHVMSRLRRKGHAVVVVAEGAGEEYIRSLQPGTPAKDQVKDGGGHTKLPPIGVLVKDQIISYCKARAVTAQVKYINPSYMIRSVAANSADSYLCLLLAQNAVHGAFAGFTGFSTGIVNNRVVYIPISTIVANSPRRIRKHGRTLERMYSVTQQPDADNLSLWSP